MAAPAFELRAELSPADDHDVLLDATPGPTGGLVTLWVTAEGERRLTTRRESSGGATFPDSRSDAPVSARVIVFAPERGDVVEIDELPIAFPTVQMLPDGQVLIVGARCHWRPEPAGPEHNAAIFSPGGTLLRTGVLGDGIEHVAVSVSGDIWVGYFDEGVFGNYGWGDHPVGSAGIVRFDRTLTPVWRLDDHSMADCYALTVDGDHVWACYYTDFPVTRIIDDVATIWRNDEVSGARALAVDIDRIALLGGYGEPDRLVLGRVGDGRFRAEQRLRLPLPGVGEGIPHSVFGRGDTLHLVAGRRWSIAHPFT